MANVLYDGGREGILDESIHMNTGDVRACLVKTSYVFDAAHVFMSDIAADDNGRSAALTSKTYTDGVFDAADPSLVATAAVPCEALAIFQHTGSDATARLIAYIDDASGLPFTPAVGQAVPIFWANTANRIFKV